MRIGREPDSNNRRDSDILIIKMLMQFKSEQLRNISL
jgi:hypothetical protein